MMKKVYFLIVLSSFSFFLEGCSKQSKIHNRKSRSIIRKYKPQPLGPTANKVDSLYVIQKKLIEPQAPEAMNTYSVDFDNDGLTDLVTIAHRQGIPQFFKNMKKKFRKISYDPFPAPIRADYLVFADFNKDEIPDVIAVNFNQNRALRGGRPELYKGIVGKNGLRYQKVQNALPLSDLPLATMLVWDFNNDGLLDLFIGTWWVTSTKKTSLSRDLILWGQKNGMSFKVDLAVLADEGKKNPRKPLDKGLRPTFSADVCYYKNKMHIVSSSTHGFKNRFWQKQGKRFYDKAEFYKVSADSNGFQDPKGGGHTLAVVCDFIQDPKESNIFLAEQTHGHDPLTRDFSSLIRLSEKAKQSRRETFYHLNKPGSVYPQRVIIKDFNGDNQNDLLVENTGFPPYSKLEFWTLNSGYYENQAVQAGIDLVNTSGVSVQDFNLDGRLDIISGQTNIRDKKIKPEIYFFKNNIQKPFFLFRLQGIRSNTQGIGAMVKVKTSKSQFSRIMKTQYGGAPTQSEAVLQIAIGEGERLEAIEVLWPFQKKSGKQLIKKYYFSKKKPGRYRLCENGKILDFSQRCHF